MDPLDPARTALIAIDTHRGHLDPAIAIQASAVRDGLDRTVGRFSAIREDPWAASSEGGRETRLEVPCSSLPQLHNSRHERHSMS